MERLTEQDTRWKGVEHYYSLKKVLNMDGVATYYESVLRTPKNKGSMSSLFKRLQPVSYEDAFNKYLESGEKEKHLKPEERGRDREELIEMARAWKEHSIRKDIPLVDYFDGMILHCAVETFDSLKWEMIAKNLLEDKGFNVRFGTPLEDCRYCIDIVAEKEGQTYLIQVKPISHFISDREHCRIDREDNVKKITKAFEKYKPSAFFILIYNSKTQRWIVNKEWKRCAFDYRHLIDVRGNLIVDRSYFSEESETLFKK